MRRVLSVVLVVAVACSKPETAKTDSATMAPPPPPAPAMLAEADVAGTWKGTAMLQGSDSVFSHWTQVCGSGTCKGTSEEMSATFTFTYTLTADSASGVSSPFTDKSMAKGQLVDHWTAHIMDGTITGTGMITLAAKPDSVLMRYRFTGTKSM